MAVSNVLKHKLRVDSIAPLFALSRICIRDCQANGNRNALFG